MTKSSITVVMPYLFVALAATLLFLPTTIQQRTTDDAIWIANGVKFQQALLDHNWEHTRLTTRPGVTVQWIIGLTAQLTFGHHMLTTASPDDLSANLTFINNVYIVFYTIAIIGSLILFIAFHSIFSSELSTVIVVLSIAHPIMSGLSNLVWTDFLLSIFFSVAALFFFASSKSVRRQYLLASGISLGAALLTKVIALSLPLLLSLVHNKKQLSRLISISALGLITFYLFYPASWQNPLLVIDRASELHADPQTVQIAPVLTKHKQSFANTLLKASPVTALLLVIAGALTVYSIATGQSITVAQKLLGITGFYIIILFNVSLFGDSQVTSIQSKRYLAPVWPLIIGGLIAYTNNLRHQLSTPKLPPLPWIVIALILIEAGIFFALE